MLHLYELFFIGLLSLQDYSLSLRLVEVRIPNYVIKGSAAQLECLYDLDGESLYSVKWYKDGNEFYRYVPRDIPPAQTFLLPGVSVDVHNSSDAIVTLREVTLQSAGRFRCEVSGEAPSFQTVTEHGDMIVVSLPDQGPPKISGGRPRYQIGDWVRINCTAGRSKPAVQLSWFINGEAADPHFLRGYDIIVSGRESLETSVLGLQFRVEQHHFRNGDMKLKCVASLSTFYWRSNEESVEGDRPQKAPVLESRETVYASNSRADPVQASKTDSLLLNKNINLFILLALATIITTYGGCGFEHIYLTAIILKNPINSGEKQTNTENSLVKIKVNKQEKKSFNHPARPTILETKKNTTRQDKQRKPLGQQQKQQQQQQQQKPCQDCIHQSHYENSAKLEQSESQFNEEMSVRLQAIFLLLVFLLLPLHPPLISLPFNNVQSSWSSSSSSSPSSAAHTTSVSVAKLTNNSTLYYNRINGIRHAPTNAPHHQINYR